ncbi:MULTISPECIES: DUF2169 domain-containing protein [unclassified Pseudomonas]|uniref:DUF2169 family type VI secretion system accessory protein n=1 Tax=unclassified Pseudomonas TaxID=196821 RepID=UPI000877117A|nr:MULTISPECIES: DUF2169 domain-containing protein [unclassified Pseudomonas]SCZ22948.1 hypothetical protein SAMN03159405_00926 [Pseudomonas sp. NFACC44-2]SDA52759.1 hypothetical protein SAMN03159429_01244 [Pseudomonas sp. NFACC51]SEJ08017.1 hypothetical protein SAMN03159298_02144 [Pseudomonas sp. NFACC07-1]SFH24299.1 hypothetical protein SAMN03159302_00924 [Pseudomonas sp. NFACC54]SFS98899.1 hypothetical protein SAMN03159306_03044 [Pseudomonas sp. NFACC48-1]
MELVNKTRLVGGYTTSTDKTGREWLVVVAKGTYGIPDHPGHPPRLLEQQVPLIMADVFPGEPCESAALYENDFALHKPRCDVLLNGHCHAPNGEPATEVNVALKVGTLVKAFKVIGARNYEDSALSHSISRPVPFTTMPITYAQAFGGVDRTHADPAKHKWYPWNPVGVGFYPAASSAQTNGLPLPNTEELDRPVTAPHEHYKPMAFGPIGRAWRQRIQWAGTYDQAWLDHQFPFLPEDFDVRYFQCAPEDQQIDFPRGGEEVALLNLSDKGRSAFRLPANLKLAMLVVFHDDSTREAVAVVDTIILEPDANRLTLTWRASSPLGRNIREVAKVIVGQTAAQFEQAKANEERMRAKQHFKSLAQLIAWTKDAYPPAEEET